MQGHVVGQQLLHCYKLLGSAFAGQLCSDRGECRRQDDGTSTGGFGPGGSIRLAALAVLLISAEVAVVLVMVAVVPGGNTASPARAEGDGMVPRGTVAVPNTEKNNMAEGRHGEKIFKMIVVPREDQDVADREVHYVCGCDTLLSEPPGTAGRDLQLTRPGLRYCAALNDCGWSACLTYGHCS